MKRYNILMVLLDGTRQDRVSISPELAAIARKGVYFSNMITAAPYTLASVHSILSGAYPTKNGVDAYYNMFKFKRESYKTLPKYFQERGYHTLADLGNESIAPKEGFDHFRIHDEYSEDLTKLHTQLIKERPKDRPFFFFYQYDKIHTNAIINVAKKYDDFSEEFFNNTEKNIERYNACIQEAGTYANELMRCIMSEKIMEETIILFFSDHGMSNGEKHGEKMYGSFLYDYTIKVFSIIIHPGMESKTIPYQTRTIDIMPTILEVIDILPDTKYELMQGKSLVPFIKNEERDDRIAFCETGGLHGPWPSPHAPNVQAIRYKNWKLIHNTTPNTWELYHLSSDNEEKNNVFGDNSGIMQELVEKLHEINEENRKEQDYIADIF